MNAAARAAIVASKYFVMPPAVQEEMDRVVKWLQDLAAQGEVTEEAMERWPSERLRVEQNK